jgi:hypothetical protein
MTGLKLCHHKLHKKGRVALIPWDFLITKEKSRFHFNPLVWAPKSDTWEGHGCGSHPLKSISWSSKIRQRCNEGTDVVRSDAVYKPSRLPDVHSLCEMMEIIREHHPNENIHGGTVDVSAACQQFRYQQMQRGFAPR